MCCIVVNKTLIFAMQLTKRNLSLMKQTINTENTQSQMRKGVLELCTLSVLAMGEAYPTEIIDQLKGSKMMIVEGTLYPLLTRLKNANYLTYRWEESTSGPPRKYYKLTPEGVHLLNELENTWDEMADAVNKLLKANKQNQQ